MIWQPPLWLASASPRRRLLLEEAGIEVNVRPADIDDGKLPVGDIPPEQWVMALALLKATRVSELLQEAGPSAGTVLSADTVCVHDGRVIGQPANADEARTILRAMRSATHHTLTGVCLLALDGGGRELFFDRAEVRIGELADEQIEAYVHSGQWRGKAGGYNLAEQVEAGWPIQCTGDPATVMGLPMRRLVPLFQPFIQQAAREGAGTAKGSS